MKADEVLRLLDSDFHNGLKAAEVEIRLKQYGYNEVPEKKADLVARFAKKFWLVAIILSMVAATVATTTGLPGLVPITIRETLFTISCSAAFSLILNDAIKFFLVKKTKIEW
jgi:magnesium-transporting ATPase (P-type)